MSKYPTDEQRIRLLENTIRKLKEEITLGNTTYKTYLIDLTKQLKELKQGITERVIRGFSQ